MAKSIKVDSLKNRRLHGFFHKSDIHETEGKLFYLIEKGINGDHDWIVGTGESPAAIWNKETSAYENPEVFGLIPNISFSGGWHFTYEAALWQIQHCRDAKLVMISVDEVMGLKKQ